MYSKSKNSRLVYSTDTGRIKTRADAGKSPPVGDGVVRISRGPKGRGGNGVSVITGLGLDAAALKSLARELKKKSGVGGCIRQWDIEIQTDQREKLQAELEKRGYVVKLAGG